VAATPTIVISFQHMDAEEEVRQQLETRLRALAEEFPETTRFEITLAPDGAGHTAHAHVTGKSTEIAPHASGSKLALAADRLVDKIERQLRRIHDKRIFLHRREAQRKPPKRNQ
jgi:ribosomal subunit interface protein